MRDKKYNRCCWECGKQFMARYPQKRYCSKTCYLKNCARRTREIKRLRKELGRCIRCDKDLKNTEFGLYCEVCKGKIRKYYKEVKRKK